MTEFTKNNTTKEEFLSIVKDGYFIGNSPEFCDDEDVVKEALQMSLEKSYPCPFYVAGKNVKNNEEMVLLALQYTNYALEYASERLKENKKFALKALKITYCFRDFSPKVQQDYTVLMKALTIYPNECALAYASDQLKDNKEVVLYAVKNNGLQLGYASERLKNDAEVVFEAVSQDGQALEYATNFRKNYKIILAAMICEKKSLLPIRQDFSYMDEEFLLENQELIGIALLHHHSLTGLSQKTKNYLSDLKEKLPTTDTNPYKRVAEYLIAQAQKYILQKKHKNLNSKKISKL